MLHPVPEPPSATVSNAPPAIWTLELTLETDDADLIERIGEQMRALACPDANRSAPPEHTCPVSWYLITSYLGSGSDDAESYRDLLNR
jgi:hypothetical protein